MPTRHTQTRVFAREVEGGTELIHGEDFSGLLLAPLWPLIAGLLEPMYEDVNEALARHCVAR